jgi:hypothetical protein
MVEEEDLPHNNTHLLTADLKDRHLCDMVNRNDLVKFLRNMPSTQA